MRRTFDREFNTASRPSYSTVEDLKTLNAALEACIDALEMQVQAGGKP